MEEEQKRLQLEDELLRRRGELFDYKFGDKTRLDNFLGLQIEDVTKLRIGVFGPTDLGRVALSTRVNERGFFNYSANETVEFENILFGKLQPGDNIDRRADGQASSQDMHQCPEFGQRLHGIIIVVKANDPRLGEGALKDYLKPVRDILAKNWNRPHHRCHSP
ncbi:hypothetical protein OS493_010526 [Desmophyllum pertusum]|uniref:Uncharacterized protein n=1 Tax=Desmophyllum pertusum TaxID=174260 RepID=A0A9X0DAL1_9CNID|nr:hypothetical protein OS493_010526 [Desmophyllum pertusum]